MKESKLLSKEHIPAGFEVIIGGSEREVGKIWNLWFNVKLTDDPGSWDDEIKLLNNMESELDEITDDQRLIRAQMAEFCRYHPTFPQSIEAICDEIGMGKFSNPIKVGCEGRGLLESLGYHDKYSVDNQVKESLIGYKTSLEKWLSKGTPEIPLDEKVQIFLAEWTEEKGNTVQKILESINPEDMSIAQLRELSEKKSGGRPFNCFNCLPTDTDVPGCKCSYAMLIDAGLLTISGKDEFKTFFEKSILEYSIALNTWLKGEPAKGLGVRVHTLLGTKDDAKVWLAACLLKTIKDNQRWHNTTELIDEHPEASSWFNRP